MCLPSPFTLLCCSSLMQAPRSTVCSCRAVALWSITKKKPVFIEHLAHGVNTHQSESEGVIGTARWITSVACLPYGDTFATGSFPLSTFSDLDSDTDAAILTFSSTGHRFVGRSDSSVVARKGPQVVQAAVYHPGQGLCQLAPTHHPLGVSSRLHLLPHHSPRKQRSRRARNGKRAGRKARFACRGYHFHRT